MSKNNHLKNYASASGYKTKSCLKVVTFCNIHFEVKIETLKEIPH